MIFDDATQKQIDAANPNSSTWVSANAGSGKTRVLTDRVARLLFEKVDPKNILCLTYTKAAASEMQNRLFKRLGSWAMMPNDGLRQDLQRMGIAGPLDAASLSHARTLFARAIETPGGLRIQTIHSFCSSILRRFPLEAGVSPQFREMEDREAELLRSEVLDEMAEGENAPLIAEIAHVVTDDALARLTADIVKSRAMFGPKVSTKDIADFLGVPADADKSDAIKIAFSGGEDGLVEEIAQICANLSATYQKFAKTLKSLNLSNPSVDDFEVVKKQFLYGSGDKEGRSKSVNFPQSNHKAAVEAFEPIINDLHDWMDRTAAAHQFQLACDARDRARLLVRFANTYLPAYENRKLRSGLLDFDDLIDKARLLLTDPLVAEWVLFKLDGGIDHVLVDEAQDTSPTQWAVIEALTREFTSGQGARSDAKRTIFVVGDKKQSIYSFQGADPEEFDRMRDYFSRSLAETDTPLFATELQYSFRSSAAILSLVDQTFTRDLAEGLEPNVQHHAFKSSLPGRVDLWPIIPDAEAIEPRPWYDPFDVVTEEKADVQLAQLIARQIKRMIGKETIPAESDGKQVRRAITPGDFLILVQQRKTLFSEIIRACKNEGLAIAGADVLKLQEQLAVRDIVALLRFLALPEDDLSLAAALRSPMFEWSEQDLFSVAHPRDKGCYLWTALRNRQDHPKTLAVLNDLRRQADFLRPYDLIQRILVRHDMRKRLVERLGAEADDALDALLAQALSYEQSATPGLTGFLHWIESEDVKVKRQIDSAGDQIRVMTVHGSKGLEAPIVILPETTARDIRINDTILEADDVPLWKMPSKEMPDRQQQLIEAKRQDVIRERRRLLYVAMTRAEKWLIVCGAGKETDDKEAWHDVIGQAMDHAGAYEQSIGDIQIKRYQIFDWDQGEVVERPTPPIVSVDAPKFAVAPEYPKRQQTLSPSDLGGAKAIGGDAGDDQETALARGRLIHKLLEHLPLYPADQWRSVAQKIVGSDRDAMIISGTEDIVRTTIALLENDSLSRLFGPDALAEVDITANLSTLDGQRIHGSIDRLIVEEGAIYCIDFKTNKTVPNSPAETPEGLLRQMGAYVEALEQIYPDHKVFPQILWTQTGYLMDLPRDLVISALQNTSSP